MILCSVIMVAVNILNLISKMKLDSFENMKLLFQAYEKDQKFSHSRCARCARVQAFSDR